MKKTYLTPTTVVVKLQTVGSILQQSAVGGDSKLYYNNESGDADGGLSRSFFFDDEDEGEY